MFQKSKNTFVVVTVKIKVVKSILHNYVPIKAYISHRKKLHKLYGIFKKYFQ